MKRKNVLLKDLYMEFRKSWPRFVSILIMVMLGVAFLSGIRACSPDMKKSADTFYDRMNLMDIRIFGDLGVTEDDLEEVKQVDGVKEAEGSYTADVLWTTEDNQLAVKLMSAGEKLDQIDIKEGRMPKTSGECLIDSRLAEKEGYGIGDVMEFKSGSEDELSDTIVKNSFTIVGIGQSPYYLSLDRGTTKIGNGDLSGFVILLPQDFTLEIYTQLIVSVDGAKNLLCYSDEYEEKVDGVIRSVEEIAGERCQIRYDSVMEEGKEKIADGEQEIADAKKKLSDGQKKIDDAKKELDDGKKEIEKNEDLLKTSEAKIKQSETQIAKGKQQIADGKKKLNQAKKQLDASKKKLDQAKAEYNKGKKEYDQGKAQLDAAKSQVTSGESQIADAKKKIAQGKEALAGQEGTIEALKKQIAALEGQEDIEEESLLQMKNTVQAFEKQKAELEQTEKEITKKEKEIAAAKEQIKEKEPSLTKAKKQLDAAKKQLSEGEKQYQEGYEEYTSSKKQLETKEKELKQGEEKLKKGKQELKEGKEKLADAKKELSEGEEEFQSAQKKWLKKKADAQKDIKEGEEELADAKKELEDLEEPEWYVLGRGSIQTFVEYEMDADRVAAIGKVVPVIFFLVAALVCLTTMTRMVSEDRTQIGVLKALGYTQRQISMKYMVYAISSSFIGSVLGFLLGQKVIPIVVIKAYGIMYTNLPDCLSPLHLSYSLYSTAAAMICIVAATYAACRKSVKAVPAELMRPESPKAGKKIMLERIPWFWKRLNFSQKAAMRNLMRYKKRLAMTVIGIGGCMGLLLVGFGLKDSIMAIGTLQFGQVRLYDASFGLEEDASDEEREELYDTLFADSRVKNQIWVKESSIDVKKDGTEKSAYLVVPKETERLNDFITLKERLSDKTYHLNDEGVIVTEKLASLLGVEKGDSVQLKEDDDKEVSAKIIGIVENYYFHYVFLSPALYEKLYGEPVCYNHIYTINKTNTEKFEDRIQTDYMELSMVSNVTFVSGTAQRVADLLRSMDAVIYIIVIAAGMLAFVVLYNLNNINIGERKRELATLKVLGFYDTEVSEYIFRENVVLTVLGIIAGVGIGLFLHRFVISTVEVDLMMFGRNISFKSYAYSVGLTIFFASFINFMMHFKIKKIDMIESLKSVE